MLILIAAAMLLAPPLATTEERLVAFAIEAIRDNLIYPRQARFRRVHLHRSTRADGRLILCGEVDMDERRRHDAWTIFAAAAVNDRTMLMIGDRGPASASPFCAPSVAEPDCRRDFSARFEAAMRRPAPAR